MRPALTERVGTEVLPDVVLRTVRVQVLQKMARPDFVNGHRQEVGLTRDVRQLIFLGPFRVRWRDVIG